MMDEDLDALVRRVDPDRWLSSRFVADVAARADLITLYALDHELARIPQIVSNPLMGEIRLAWWREGLEEIAAGKAPRAHPVLAAVADGGLPLDQLVALATARLGDLDSQAVSEAHLDATAGLVATVAAQRLSSEAQAEQLLAAARAWALARRDGPGALRALAAARGPIRALPVAAFPAIANATLVRPYARGRTPGDLSRRLAILAAVLFGRIA